MSTFREPFFTITLPTGFLHRNQIFDVTIENSDYDVKNLIVTQKSVGF